MHTNTDFKSLWKKQDTPAPNTAEVLGAAKKFRATHVRKLIAANVMLLLTSAFIIGIWYYYQPQMITTKLGIVVVIVAMMLFLFAYNKLFPLLQAKTESSASEYLAQLLKLQKQQLHLQTTVMNIYFIMLSIGICLYMYEYAIRMSALGMLLTYGITLGWIAINWFLIRPRVIRKQRAATNGLIEKFQRLSDQLTTSDNVA